ncbi:UDP-N-acetyl-D-glucosamine 2-epimerase, UDP-hydrolysing [Desulfocapsa sulfexigens DSM 10523]|uniref:UDP-N-acetyl-D-glucosamine 2-epimerase, UDP-hydrolysing n=1 Tax=Desulfocapsa sulfexigens (strain DSM 10523 / SB164P1) TaxID=1167006 RepID=M1P844_DESSD|nr:UDP-N-acetylglucosamine 2-epimerase [Desulfocapsa sulfexigens]AGF79648.1 UDP-N-acetyl-D-glucosamine 2-epimerase, UDP-hydrolysing [Desulfocapsa sulfexigens DSM 10523]
MKKRILFITATRADFGKLKSLIRAVKESNEFEYQIFGTGMHMLAKYGGTIKEIPRSGFDNLFTFMNQVEGESMEVVLANTIIGLSRYLAENKIDLIVVHGDRVEALAGATVGALRNILVAHIEGGEISGTVDELMRHAISKLSHIHFVANDKAEQRLKQLGEDPDAIYCIGSPDVDVMLSDELPSLEEAKARYEVTFDSYSVAMLHPVTTELEIQFDNAALFADALLESKRNYIVIYPNNDSGSEYIFAAYKRLQKKNNIRIFPSLRFEHYLTFLRNADCLIGNSSAGIHEAPIYGVPTINIGTRQQNRFKHPSIFDVPFDREAILSAIKQSQISKSYPACNYYGLGDSAKQFTQALKEDVWKVSNQKLFRDVG